MKCKKWIDMDGFGSTPRIGSKPIRMLLPDWIEGNSKSMFEFKVKFRVGLIVKNLTL